MKTTARRRGFTLIELLVVVTIIAMLAGGAYLGYSALLPKFRSSQAASQAKNIHLWLTKYSSENGGDYPEGDTANLAYRELFKANAGADEKQFYISGCAYHDPATEKGPDGDIGRAPEFNQALETGENAFAYVSGLTASDEGRLPIIANGFAGTPGVWSKNKKDRGGVFQGKYGVVGRISGACSAVELKGDDLMIKERAEGQEVNIFTESYYGDATPNVVNPN